jgi:hypothetical protein
MFCFFNDDNIVDFWGNSKDDEFFELTCKSMKWLKSKVDLVYYEDLLEIPSHFDIDENKILTIKNKIVEEIPQFDENDLPIFDLSTGEQVVVENITYEIIKTLVPDFYVTKGIMVKPC